MDADEVYLYELEARKRAQRSYQALADQAEDEAYDELTEHIQDALPLVDSRDYLIQIATIWQQPFDANDIHSQMAEKYALIGDVFQKIIGRNAENKMRSL